MFKPQFNRSVVVFTRGYVRTSFWGLVIVTVLSYSELLECEIIKYLKKLNCRNVEMNYVTPRYSSDVLTASLYVLCRES